MLKMCNIIKYLLQNKCNYSTIVISDQVYIMHQNINLQKKTLKNHFFLSN